MMKYENVCIEGMGYVIPEQVVTSSWFEEQLAPIYRRLNIKRSFFGRVKGIFLQGVGEEGIPTSGRAPPAGRPRAARARGTACGPDGPRSGSELAA